MGVVIIGRKISFVHPKDTVPVFNKSVFLFGFSFAGDGTVIAHQLVLAAEKDGFAAGFAFAAVDFPSFQLCNIFGAQRFKILGFCVNNRISAILRSGYNLAVLHKPFLLVERKQALVMLSELVSISLAGFKGLKVNQLACRQMLVFAEHIPDSVYNKAAISVI